MKKKQHLPISVSIIQTVFFLRVHAICTTYAQTHAIIDYEPDRSHVCYGKFDHGRKLRKAMKSVILLCLKYDVQ